MNNPFEQLNNLYNKPQMLPGEVSQVDHLSQEDKSLLKKIGLTSVQVQRDLLADAQIFYDRYNLYHQVEKALEHPIVGAATELYANYCTVFSPMHNATIWITSESPTYQKELTKLLDRVGIEEKIFDWAFTAGSYGDMFVKVNGIPGQGVISLDDSDHPINISRVDHEGVLIGYYKTPVGQAGDQQRLMAPWEYVHFRLLGGKKQRPQFGDQSYAEYRTVHLLTGLRSKQVTTRYGTSVIMNALAIYRRLRLAEDSLLIARLSRGLIRYVWKLKVDSANMEAVGELIDQYSRVLREARSMDTTPGSPNFDSKENPMCSIEDIFIPVWDNVGDLVFDKIGGETDIRWIRDIEDLRQQLAAALRTPLPLLGAWLKEATGPLGSQAIEKVDINFARMARKLQRTVRTGIKRICQIHLAYMNMDPDPNLFDVQMPEMSTAEEESLKDSLKEGMEVVSGMMETVDGIIEGTDKKLDKIEIFNYLNEKILKLEDFDLKEYLVAVEEVLEELPPIEELPEEERPLERKKREKIASALETLRFYSSKQICEKRRKRMAYELKVKKLFEKSMLKEDKDRIYKKPCLFDTDLQSYVPTTILDGDGEVNETIVTKLGRNGGWLGIERCMEVWKTKYGDCLIEEKDPSELEEGEVEGQLVLPFEES